MENHKRHTKNLPHAIALALSAPLATAATYNVTEAQDDGTGLVANTLSWAILQANTTVGADIIELNTDVTMTGVMKRLIDSDTTLQSDATRRTIDGNNQFRPLFIKSGQVTIQNLDIQNGRAQGGSGLGRGAGMGGSIFIYSGFINLNNVSIKTSKAIGGYSGGGGAGGMYGSGMIGAGGGLFANSSSQNGGYGGYGSYQDIDNLFGEGGSYGQGYTNGQNGGFGGGGGDAYNGNSGDGGFGGGGSSFFGYSGNGGFGAGGGQSGSYDFGVSGFGGYGTLAAGMGGAIFIREGYLNFYNTFFESNIANKTERFGEESKGYGGALFVIHSTQNSNGNNQGMPNTLPTVTGCGVTFSNNTADTDPGQPNNNDDIFDLGNRIQPDDGVSLTTPCGPPDQEIQISGNGIEIIDGDVTPDLTDGTDLGEEVAGFNQASQTFTIENLGNHPIQLTGDPLVSLTNNNNSQFEISQQPASSVIFGGQSLEFQVTFAPQNTGTDTATVVIESNDPDESTYEFQIQGNGLAAEAEMDVKGNGIEIMDGDITPDVADDTDFGISMIGLETVTKTFTIDNINGYAGLTLTGNPVVELQNNSGQFAVTNQPANNLLEPGQSVTFDVTFTPANEGVDSVTVSITNNDSDENPYDFVIQAEGIVLPPEIRVRGNGVEISDGDTTPDFNDLTLMGQAQESAQTITHTFSISNSNLGTLFLSGMPTVELQNNSGQFSISAQPQLTSLELYESTTFDVTFTPISVGVDSATVVIQNNDPDEAPYDFVIEAEGIPQEGILQIYDNGVPLVNGDDAFFGYVPVTDGEAEKTFEIKNIGFASMDISDPVITQFSGEYSISQNITEYTLDPNESTFVSVKYDPVLVGFAGSGSSLDVGYGNSGYFNFISLYGYGQPTVTINAENNYLQEGEMASFTVTADVEPYESLPIDWQVAGQVDGSDFGGLLPSGTGHINLNIDSFNIDFATTQDGVYEGPEFFNVQISSNSPKIHIGFPSVSGGVIDDDWIFDDGFEVPTLNQFLMAISKYAYDLNDSPVCNELACNFLQRSISIDTEHIELINMMAWFEETLVLKQPNGDWDGDGLPNHHDLNPFGLSEAMLSKIKN